MSASGIRLLHLAHRCAVDPVRLDRAELLAQHHVDGDQQVMQLVLAEIDRHVRTTILQPLFQLVGLCAVETDGRQASVQRLDHQSDQHGITGTQHLSELVDEHPEHQALDRFMSVAIDPGLIG